MPPSSDEHTTILARRCRQGASTPSISAATRAKPCANSSARLVPSSFSCRNTHQTEPDRAGLRQAQASVAQSRRTHSRNHLHRNRRDPQRVYPRRMRQLFPKLRLRPNLNASRSRLLSRLVFELEFCCALRSNELVQSRENNAALNLKSSDRSDQTPGRIRTLIWPFGLRKASNAAGSSSKPTMSDTSGMALMVFLAIASSTISKSSLR